MVFYLSHQCILLLSLWSLGDPLLFGVRVFERMIKGNQHLYTHGLHDYIFNGLYTWCMYLLALFLCELWESHEFGNLGESHGYRTLVS